MLSGRSNETAAPQPLKWFQWMDYLILEKITLGAGSVAEVPLPAVSSFWQIMKIFGHSPSALWQIYIIFVLNSVYITM